MMIQDETGGRLKGHFPSVWKAEMPDENIRRAQPVMHLKGKDDGTRISGAEMLRLH